MARKILRDQESSDVKISGKSLSVLDSVFDGLIQPRTVRN